MVRRTLISAALLVAILPGFVVVDRALAGCLRSGISGCDGVQVTSSDNNSRFLVIGRNKSITIDLPRDITEVLVADPNTVTAVALTNRRVTIIGKQIGQSNIYFYDDRHLQIAAIDVNVNYGAPPHELQTYDQPATVVTVFRGVSGRHYSCTPTDCVANHLPDDAGSADYPEVSGGK